MPLSRTSSTSSVASNDSTNTSAFDNPVDSAVKRTRKRFSSVQLMMLEHLYHKVSHPTREQREQVAKEAEIDIRSVTVWFQNKRQMDRRLHRQLSETIPPPSRSTCTPVPPSSPFSDASGNTIHTVRARTRTLSGTSSSSALSVTSASTNRSRKRDREGEGDGDAHSALQSRHVRLKPSRHLSLDAIAGRTERPVLLPRIPPQQHTLPPPSSSPRPRTPTMPDTDARERALWENMPSSPPDPIPRVEKTLVRFGSKRYALEYACAREIVGVRGGERGRTNRTNDGWNQLKNRSQGRMERCMSGRTGVVKEPPTTFNHSAHKQELIAHREEEQDDDVPVADWDTYGDTDTEEVCSETPVTPSSSFSFVEPSHGSFDNPQKIEPTCIEVQVAQSFPDDEDVIDAAYVLCGLRQRR